MSRKRGFSDCWICVSAFGINDKSIPCCSHYYVWNISVLCWLCVYTYAFFLFSIISSIRIQKIKRMVNGNSDDRYQGLFEYFKLCQHTEAIVVVLSWYILQLFICSPLPIISAVAIPPSSSCLGRWFLQPFSGRFASGHLSVCISRPWKLKVTMQSVCGHSLLLYSEKSNTEQSHIHTTYQATSKEGIMESSQKEKKRERKREGKSQRRKRHGGGTQNTKRIQVLCLEAYS